MRLIIILLGVFLTIPIFAQNENNNSFDATQFDAIKFRNIGPFRGGRSNTACGVIGDPMTYYMGSTGGGVWKTTDAGVSWNNISDGFFNTGSVGAIAVSESDANVIYVGMGEHAVRGVMTSHGDGVYKSEDAGKTWVHLGLEQSRHIARIRIHPKNPDIVYVAVQGAVHGSSSERGIYKSVDGGQSWEKIFYVDENTGASDISMDMNNPRILYASTWEHRRYPWTVESGGVGSGLWKSTDSGANWNKLEKGLPEAMGKTGIDVSRANSDVVYANIEAEGEKGGVYRSNDGGNSWKQTTNDRVTIARSWYYTEIYADPVDVETVYVMNAPFLKSIDGGKTFKNIPVPHGDQHDLWINPTNNQNMINANDGGANISFNSGKTWSRQDNQPTAQFYRVITDNRFPYYVYGGQQDNSTMAIASRTNRGGVSTKDWYAVSGCESAFIAFNPDNPTLVYGGCYQGNISLYDTKTNTEKDIMAYPFQGLSWTPKDMKYRFNWNAPIVSNPYDQRIVYHCGNVVFKTDNEGQSWKVISPDLTRNDTTKQGAGGGPYTIEGAGGENYNTISYFTVSNKNHWIRSYWVGTDDGFVHRSKNTDDNWENVTPKGIGEALINSIEVSPHDHQTAYVVATRYKFNDFAPMVYKTTDFGKTWTKITNGIDDETFVRVVREDRTRKGLLYAGTEKGLYISFNDGKEWHKFQSNLPVCPITDLAIQDNDLVVATSGRSFWILDDLSALQQSKGVVDGSNIAIIQPKPTVRFDAPSPPKPVGIGQNPMNGVIIDYFLPRELEEGETLTLDIINKDGYVIRSFSSKKSGSKPYIGGPAPVKPMSTNVGFNRMAWDMRGSGVTGVEKVFVLGDYRGGLVAPGSYTLSLTLGDETVETAAYIKPDPRLTASQADYIAQEDFTKSIEEVVLDIHNSVNQMRQIKTQANNVIDVLDLYDRDSEEILIAQANDLIKKIEQWESNLIQPKQKTFQDVINFPNQLNTEFLNLKSRMDGHNPSITAGAKVRFNDLMAEWNIYKKAYNDLINNDIQAFNKAFKASGVDVLMLPKK